MKSWVTNDGTITENHLSLIEARLRVVEQATAFQLAVFMGWTAAGEKIKNPVCDRRIDRALQLLKRQGRIRYDHHGRKWVAVGGGGK